MHEGVCRICEEIAIIDEMEICEDCGSSSFDEAREEALTDTHE